MPLAAEVNEALDFLVTMIDVSEPGMRQIPQRSSVGPITDEACVVTISARNAAPPNPDGPQVVFVGLTFVIRGVVGNGELSQAWAREISLDRLEAPPRSPADVPTRQRKGGQEYPVLTSAEQKLGQYLFPGQTVSCRWTIPTSDVSQVLFDVEATVSRRHLFHVRRTLTP